MSHAENEAQVLRWPTADQRQKICAAFCEHISAGYSIDSFPEAGRKTIRYYAEQFPEDFPPDKLEEAARRGLLEWETIGKDGAKGSLAKFNASTWAFVMKNRAGWRDKSDIDAIGFLGGSDEAQKIESFRPRSAQEIALGVMALLTRKDVPGNGDSTDKAD